MEHKYLNLGCGGHYSTEKPWTNIDFTSNNTNVIEHNLLSGIPFSDNYFDFVYHSHVLEHFSKDDGAVFISECFRVVKSGGFLRIAIPDLEQIVRNYLLFLENGISNQKDIINRANYEWMLLEMYDQTVRNRTGGNMLKYLCKDILNNEDFVYARIGQEGMDIRQHILNNRKVNIQGHEKNQTNINISVKIRKAIKSKLLSLLKIDENIYEIGRFRVGGEIHQWMYDRYSLTNLLDEIGFYNITVKDAFSSSLTDWSVYKLDGNLVPRKPDSLYIEAQKK